MITTILTDFTSTYLFLTLSHSFSDNTVWMCRSTKLATESSDISYECKSTISYLLYYRVISYSCIILAQLNTCTHSTLDWMQYQLTWGAFPKLYLLTSNQLTWLAMENCIAANKVANLGKAVCVQVLS